MIAFCGCRGKAAQPRWLCSSQALRAELPFCKGDADEIGAERLVIQYLPECPLGDSLLSVERALRFSFVIINKRDIAASSWIY